MIDEEKKEDNIKEEDKDKTTKLKEKKEEMKNAKRRKVSYKELFKLFLSKKNLQILVFISSGPCK